MDDISTSAQLVSTQVRFISEYALVGFFMVPLVACSVIGGVYCLWDYLKDRRVCHTKDYYNLCMGIVFLVVAIAASSFFTIITPNENKKLSALNSNYVSFSEEHTANLSLFNSEPMVYNVVSDFNLLDKELASIKDNHKDGLSTISSGMFCRVIKSSEKRDESNGESFVIENTYCSSSILDLI